VLPHPARLRNRAEFSEAVRRGARAASPALVLHLVAGSPDQPARVGFVVSRAVGPAVTRNLVRRRLRHLVHDRLPLVPAGSRLVVRATPAAAAASYPALCSQLDRALARLIETTPASTGALR
jgi:ribonuclease P protein component